MEKEIDVTRVTINDLLEAGCHFGHQTKRWNPKMKKFIYGSRNGITIFDLRVTIQALAATCNFLRDTVAAGGNVLFVGAKRQAQEAVREAAEATEMYYMCDRWLGGTLTNNKVVLSRVSHMKKLQKIEAEGATENMTKKELAGLRREREKLERVLGGIAEMRKLPAAMIVVDVEREFIAVREANKLGIPVVGIVDSNANPDLIDYVVPGNDDALKAIRVFIDAFSASIEEGKLMGGRKKEAPQQEEAPAPKLVAAPIPEPDEKPADESEDEQSEPGLEINAEEEPDETVEEAQENDPEPADDDQEETSA